MKIVLAGSEQMGVTLPGLKASERGLARPGCLLLLLVLLPLSGCLNSPALGDGDRRTDDSGPVTLEVTLKNNGSKPLATWLNITGPAAFVVRQSFQQDPNDERNYSFVLHTRSNYAVVIDRVVRGESVELAGQTLTSDSFRGSDELGFDTSDCGPNSKIRIDSAAWYYNAGNPVLNPILKHGIHGHTSWELCDPASSSSGGNSG